MDSKYWLKKWQANDIDFHVPSVNSDLIAYLHELKLCPGDCIFVPLCGKSKDMIWLVEKGFSVIGVELSSIACNDFFSELGVIPNIIKRGNFIIYQYNTIQLFCGDLFDLKHADLPPVHAVYDCKALIALPPDVRKKYVTHLVTILGDKIKILLLSIDTSDKVSPPPFPISRDEVNLLYGNYFNIQQLKRLLIFDIPKILIKKGYANMVESAYLISL